MGVDYLLKLGAVIAWWSVSHSGNPESAGLSQGCFKTSNIKQLPNPLLTVGTPEERSSRKDICFIKKTLIQLQKSKELHISIPEKKIQLNSVQLNPFYL